MRDVHPSEPRPLTRDPDDAHEWGARPFLSEEKSISFSGCNNLQAGG